MTSRCAADCWSLACKRRSFSTVVSTWRPRLSVVMLSCCHDVGSSVMAAPSPDVMTSLTPSVVAEALGDQRERIAARLLRRRTRDVRAERAGQRVVRALLRDQGVEIEKLATGQRVQRD